jgi:hypothetical protein
METVGSFSNITTLADGDLRGVGGVFSASDTLHAPAAPHRIPGAIGVGVNYPTPAYCTWVLLWCVPQPATNIAEDFGVTPEVDVVIPAGAQYLFLAPTDPGIGRPLVPLLYKDNSGLGFGVTIEVIPGS